jgi:hypothetical protein
MTSTSLAPRGAAALPMLGGMDQYALAAELRRFGREECRLEPVYAALCDIAAKDARALALLAEAPPAQRKVNLLLAALHERVLAGATPALAAYFPSTGGTREPDIDLAVALDEALESQWPTLLRHLRERATQTNEVGRCSALWPALGAVAQTTGRRDLALLDFGCSAGLNLGVDHYALRYRTDGGALHEPAAKRDGRRAEIDTRWLGDAPVPAAAEWRVVARHGVDPAPIDVNDPAGLRWLQACLWPHDAARRERLARAARQLQGLPVTLARAEDSIAAIEPWLDAMPAGVQPVLLTSWVLYYFDVAELARLRAMADRLARSHALAWICGDLARLSAQKIDMPPEPTLPADQPPSTMTLWTLRTGHDARALAWSHPHGRWIHWLR